MGNPIAIGWENWKWMKAKLSLKIRLLFSQPFSRL